jgi:adenylate kinase
VDSGRAPAGAKSARAAASLGVVLIGPPGSGKNTHARMLAARYGMEPVSARGLLAKAAADSTGSWTDVRKMMAEGHLVPDEKIEELIFARLRGAQGYLLDGFPRTAAQAKFLDGIRRPDVVVYLSADEETLLARLSSRLVCGSCGRSYGAEAAPSHPGICDDCGYKLSAREDDSSSAAQARLREYNEKTRLLLQHYRDVLHPVRSAGRAEDVHARICAIIEERVSKRGADSARGASPPRRT